MTFAFLEAVLIEVLELFPGPVHVGMDEIPARAWSQQPEEEEMLMGWSPSGKHTKNYGKSPFFMGKSTISTDGVRFGVSVLVF